MNTGKTEVLEEGGGLDGGIVERRWKENWVPAVLKMAISKNRRNRRCEIKAVE